MNQVRCWNVTAGRAWRQVNGKIFMKKFFALFVIVSLILFMFSTASANDLFAYCSPEHVNSRTEFCDTTTTYVCYNDDSHFVRYWKSYYCAECATTGTYLLATGAEPHQLNDDGVCDLCLWGTDSPLHTPKILCSLNHFTPYRGTYITYRVTSPSYHQVHTFQAFHCSKCTPDIGARGLTLIDSTTLPHEFTTTDTGRAVCTLCQYSPDVVVNPLS